MNQLWDISKLDGITLLDGITHTDSTYVVHIVNYRPTSICSGYFSGNVTFDDRLLLSSTLIFHESQYCPILNAWLICRLSNTKPGTPSPLINYGFSRYVCVWRGSQYPVSIFRNGYVTCPCPLFFLVSPIDCIKFLCHLALYL